MKYFKRLLLALVAVTSLSSSAQVAIKSNLIGWGVITPNLGIEAGTSKHSTVELMAYLNPWEFGEDKKHFKFWTIQPEYRYWFCERFNGWFLGVHLLGGEYSAMGINFPLRKLTWGNAYDLNPDFNISDHSTGWPDLRGENLGRHAEGWYAGGGISVGYQHPISKHWNLEASVGIGYVYSDLRYYGRCRQRIDKRHLNYAGITNLQLSFLYLF